MSLVNIHIIDFKRVYLYGVTRYHSGNGIVFSDRDSMSLFVKLFPIDESIDKVLIYDARAFKKIRGSDSSVLESNIYLDIYGSSAQEMTKASIIERINSLNTSTYSFRETYSIVRFVF